GSLRQRFLRRACVAEAAEPGQAGGRRRGRGRAAPVRRVVLAGGAAVGHAWLEGPAKPQAARRQPVPSIITRSSMLDGTLGPSGGLKRSLVRFPLSFAAVLVERTGDEGGRAMKLCISEATTLSSTFAEDVAAYAEAGWPGVEVWLTKLEQHLEKHSAPETRRLLADHSLQPAAASYQGGLLLSQGEQRRGPLQHFRPPLDPSQYLGTPTLLVAAAFAPPVEPAALPHAVAALQEAAQWAAACDVRLALEFRGSARFCASLDTAVAVVAQCGEPNVGVNFDV